MQDLKKNELADLIHRYESEVRKLKFQLQKTTETIQDLKGRMEDAPVAATVIAATTSAPQVPKRGRGRPRKSEAQKAASQNGAAPEAVNPPKRKRGRPKGSTNKKKVIRRVKDGYRLSEWDSFIINSLKKANKVLVNSDLMELGKEKVKKEKLKLDDIQLRGKLNRSIHKLANKRGKLVKVDFPGKGFAYGLEDWADKSGKVKAKYRK
jgi:hypothetical protein